MRRIFPGKPAQSQVEIDRILFSTQAIHVRTNAMHILSLALYLGMIFM